MNVVFWITIYLIIINLAGFAMMGIDKARARRKAWRIPELHLFVIALVGGSIGSIIGMYTFRHKTRHMSFTMGMPIILIVQILGVVALILSPVQLTIF